MRPLERREKIAVAITIVAMTIVFFGRGIWQFFAGAPTQSAAVINNIASTTPDMTNISTVSGLEIYDEKVGTGAEAVAGKTVTAHYVGVLQNGQKFDSSLDRGQPFSFPLGAGRVIRGWDLGIAGMKVGGVRRLVIAPSLGYGNQPIGNIPANSTLIFEVQLLDVK